VVMLAPHKQRGGMDTSKLVVGQVVYMFCGVTGYGFAKGEVVKITPAGVEVKSAELWGRESQPLEEVGIVRFDNNGIELEANRRKRHGFEPGPGFSQDRFMQSVWYGAPECGPWTLDDIPFAERTAKIEETAALSEYYGRIQKSRVVGKEVWMVSGRYSIKGKVVKVTIAETEMREGKMVITEAAGVEVQELTCGELRRFYYNGTQYAGSHHPEFGPWQMDDRPFEERTALEDKVIRQLKFL
jgi:hypothetical protein